MSPPRYDKDPDFSPKQSKFDWSVNIPTLLSVLGVGGGLALSVISMWHDAGIERNNMAWQIKELQGESADGKRDRDDLRTTLRQLADAQLQASKAQDRTAQTLEWLAKNPQHSSP